MIAKKKPYGYITTIYGNYFSKNKKYYLTLDDINEGTTVMTFDELDFIDNGIADFVEVTDSNILLYGIYHKLLFQDNFFERLQEREPGAADEFRAKVKAIAPS